MTVKEIQDLIKFVSKSGATEVSLETGDIKLTIKTESKKGTSIVQQIPVTTQAQEMSIAVPVTAAPAAAAPAAAAKEEDETSKYITIKSPIIGTFYRKSSPDKPEFKLVGDDVQNGDVVCIIEAMKLFNEIESEISGKIVKVLVDDMSPVEYDQPLFLVDPS